MSERLGIAFKTDILCKYCLIRKRDFERKPANFSVKRYEASKFFYHLFYNWLSDMSCNAFKSRVLPGQMVTRGNFRRYRKRNKDIIVQELGGWPPPPTRCFCISFFRKLIECIYHCRFSPFVSGAVFGPKVKKKKFKKIKCQRLPLWKWGEGLKKYRL